MKNTVSMMSALLMSLASIAQGSAQTELPQNAQLQIAELASSKGDIAKESAEIIAETLKQQMPEYVVFESFNAKTDCWSNSSKFVFRKDGKGNLASQLELEWEDGEWKYRNKTIFQYDRDNNCVSEAFYSWNSTGLKWDVCHKVERQFSENRNENKRSYYVWNTASDSFELQSSSYFEYDSQNRVTSFLHKSINKAYLKKEFIFNDHEVIASSMTYSWNSSMKQWDYVSKESVSSHVTKPIVTTTSYNWNPQIESWETVSALKQTFNKKGAPKTITYTMWDNDSQRWDAVCSKERFLYGTNGSLKSKTTGIYNSRNKTWESYTIDAYANDDSGKQQLQMSYIESEENNQLLPLARKSTVYNS